MNLVHRAVSQQVRDACIDAPRSLEMHKKYEIHLKALAE